SRVPQTVARGGRTVPQVRRSTVMFLRWKRRHRHQQPPLYYAELVRSVRRHGTPRQQVVGYLGAISAEDRAVPARYQAFWHRVDVRWTGLGVDAVPRQAVEARLAQVVPRPGPRPAGPCSADQDPVAHDLTVGTTDPACRPRLPGGLYVRWKRRPLRRRAD